MSERERAIIGCLLLNKSLDPQSFGLEKKLFKEQNARLICDQILSGVRDEVEIFEGLRTKSQTIASFLASCTDGLHKSGASEDRIRELIKNQKAELINAEILKSINAGAGKGSYDHEKIKSLYDKINELNVNQNKNRPQAETLKEFLARDIPKRQTLIDPILGLQEMTMIHGRPKIGKSLLTLQLARCLVTGENWLGFKTHRLDRPVLIIQVEIAPALMQDRARKVFGDIADSERIIIPHQNRNIFFDQKSGRENVLCLIEDYKPGFVILDPYSRFFTDEETALKNPRPFFDFWQEQIEVYNFSLLFVHHDAKFQEGKLGGQKALGATLINAATDGNWSIERILDADLEPVEFLKIARLSFESRNWQNTRPLDIRLNDDLCFELTILPKRTVNEWDIVEEIEKAGGQIEQKELIKQYSNMRAFYQAKNKAIGKDLIDEVKLENVRGKPVMLMLKMGNTER